MGARAAVEWKVNGRMNDGVGSESYEMRWDKDELNDYITLRSIGALCLLDG